MELKSDTQKTIDFLNLLLESERAGVKVIHDLLTKVNHDSLKVLLKNFLSDEGMNCQVLNTLINHFSGEISQKTGNFVEKINALPNLSDQITLLIKGQEWIVKQIRQYRHLVTKTSHLMLLESIKIQHEENVDALKHYQQSNLIDK